MGTATRPNDHRGDPSLTVIEIRVPGGAAVLPLDPDRAGPLLHVAGLVDDQHRPLVVQVLHHVTPHVVTDRIGVPLGPAEQVVHRVWRGLPDPFGDRPAVLAREVRQETEHQPLDSPTGLHACEAARDPVHQALECVLPSGRVYAVTCGHRLIVRCLHKPR